MYHPEGFADSSNIIIKNNCAFYYYNGNSYLEKFKNGLSLESVFDEELIKPTPIIELTKEGKDHNNNKNSFYVFIDDYEGPLCDVPKKRKQTKNYKTQKRKCKNRKNRIRQNGFNDKMFITYQNTIHLEDTLNKSELRELYLNEYYNECDEYYKNYYQGVQEYMNPYYDLYDYDYNYDNYDCKELYRSLLSRY